MSISNRPAGLTRILNPLAALALAAAALAPASAFASTAANTTIVNTATVNYNDAGNNPQTAVQASATVLVTLVPSAPLLSSPANVPGASQGTATVLTYTITGTANGQDTYTLGSNVVSANVSAVTATVQASISLGGTTLAGPAAAGNNSILAPYDGVPGNGSLNGLIVGSVISIGGNPYTITTITKNAVANTTTIGINTPIVGATVAAGLIVGETKLFTVSVPSGNVTSGNSGTETVTTTATGSGGVSTTQGTPTVITVQRPTLTVTKTVSIDGGANFNASANAPPGTVLVYKIVATNTGTSAANAVTFTDVIPQYLTYVANSGKYSTVATATYTTSTTALADGAAGYTFAANTVGYNPASVSGSTIGTVAGSGGVLILFFQAKIN